MAQRLAARDPSLLDLVPFTPVIVQRMIGESDATKLPKCGVMFTEEAEGGVSRNEPGKRSGITLIQAAYGHNEAVVNSRIPVDSYYIDHLKNVFPIIRVKTHRMKPSVENAKLELVRNEDSIAKRKRPTDDVLTVIC